MATTPLPNSGLAVSSFLTKSDPSSLTSDPGGLARQAVLKCLVRAQEPERATLDAGPPAVKQRRLLETRSRHLPISPTSLPAARAPAPYPQNLTPTPFHLWPHCLAQDWLRMWTPAAAVLACPGTPNEADQEQIKDTMIHAWEEDTQVSYGASLLMWHCFCDGRAMPETERAPASQPLLSAFVAHMAAVYSGKTISNYLNGVQAWHLLHSVPWLLEKREMDTIL